ncbi:hypothetical protein [Flavisolibacter nicotianae]|uniref:hypothetical protein n=1 Tax=Flavisolibacter nicotianae TaxID=2364882 RepID=UPI000EB54001|nr:hypothetical protein [Flavisolibacter nicotianae]
MPVTNDVYDQLKIDKLKHFLEAHAEKGFAKPFEIFVDNLKVVAKTDDPKEFDSYEFYMNEDTEKVRILIYNSNLSPRNDQYCFMVQKTVGSKSLNGLGEIENIVQEKLAARDREYEMNRLREELEAAKQDLEETEEYAEKLEKEIQDLKQNKFKLGNINVAEFASVALESMVRRNPQILTKLPGGAALAGFVEQDNKEQEARLLQQQSGPEPNVSFQKETTSEITEEEKRYLAYLKAFEKNLTQEQAEMFNLILQAMVNDPTLIPTVLDLITTKQ